MKAATLGIWSVKCPQKLLKASIVPQKLLMGPGPSNMSPEITQSLSQPLLGHLHKEFLEVMDDVKEGIKYAFQTTNTLTFAVSGSGHAGMECALVNLLEKDEKLLVVENGIWGNRAADLADRLGVQVKKVIVPAGQAVDLDKFEKAVTDYKPNVVFVCHGESSTGVCHPLDGLGDICHKADSLFLVDTVASLGAAPFSADYFGVDCVYSASQKVLNAPPGLAPISFSAKAQTKIQRRKTRVPSFYFDALELGNYWGCDGQPRRYHHTGLISLNYSLRTALAKLATEGITASIDRHYENVNRLYGYLESIGLEPFVEKEEWRLPCLTTVKVPEGYAANDVVAYMMSKNIEIGGGLGPTAGKVWRIGTYGRNSDLECIKRTVDCLKEALEVCRGDTKTVRASN